MKKTFVLTAIFAATALSGMAESLYFDGTTDRDPLLYRVGESITFTVILRDSDAGNVPVKGRKLVWTRTGDDQKSVSGTANSDRPLTVSTTLDRPGFVRLVVNVLDENGTIRTGEREKFDGGAGCDVNRIEATPPPTDFDRFWNAEVKKLASEPFQPVIKEVPSGDNEIRLFEFILPTRPKHKAATGIFALPKNAQPKSLPLLFITHGYGFGATPKPIQEAKAGAIVFAMTRQGEEPLREEAYYKELEKNECRDFAFRHTSDLYQNDFYNMILRNLRALQYAKTIPEWNQKDIATRGGSMGGFQALALAALDPSVTFCHAEVPWLSDLQGADRFGRLTGWRPKYTPTLSYFDTANLALRVKCRTTILIRLGDYICPPSGQMILFRNLAGEKNLIVIQNGGHGIPYTPIPVRYEYSGAIH